MPTTTVTYNNKLGSLGGPVSFRRAGVSRFCLPDMQGHIRQLADINGNITDTFTPDAWGVQKAATGNTINNYKAFGKWGYFTDTPSRHNVRDRILHIEIGRWMSTDPIRQLGLSLYVYCANNPATQFDPSGALHEIPYAVNTAWEIGESVKPPAAKCCCGTYFAIWRIVFDKGVAPCSGVVVQRVRGDFKTWKCPPDIGLVREGDTCIFEFGQEVKQGQPLQIIDLFYNPASGSNYGYEHSWAVPKLLCDVSKRDLIKWGFKPNCMRGAKTNLCYPCFVNRSPKWWTDANSAGEKPGIHDAFTNWNCCQNCSPQWSYSRAYPSATAPRPCL